MRSLRVCISCLAAAFVLALSLAVPARAQVVSGGITGLVVDSGGKPVFGADVSAVHIPTGTQYRAMTRSDGRYNFRSLIVGGPYAVTVTEAGFKSAEVTDITTQLGGDVDANFVLNKDTEVVTMEKLTVEASTTDLDSNASGAGSVIDSGRLGGKPTTQRSLADIISISPLVTLRATSGDREESQISAVGQNARFNSILIDGARINDQFGLNFTGLASFFNPLSLDTIEQLTVDVSPYDVRQSGFTGASINAVTKSGTNQFKGTVYYMFSGDEWLGVQMQGEDIGTLKTQNRKFVPKLERTTYGATFGGPIWKNKIFFFASYEKFERVQAPSDPGFTPNAGDLAAIKAQLTSATGINWGQPGGSSAANTTEDKKILAKIDWNITNEHRLSVRYSTTEGELPQYGSFTSTSARGINSTPTGPGYAFDSYFYSQERKEKVIAAQLLSQWTPDFKTEVKYSKTKQDQLTPTNSSLPLLNISGVPGISQSGGSTTGFVFAGTEFSRHGNQIFVDTQSYSATGDYFWKDFIFTAGFDREESDFYNLFRSGSYGQFDLTYTAGTQSLATTGAFNRAYYDPALRPAADLSSFAVTGVFAQTKWNVNPRLALTGGIRVDGTGSDTRPRFNQKLFDETGFRNDGTVDGVKIFSPRVGFNWGIDEQRTVQLRGGIGRFLGRAPWVLFSNSYNQLGVGTFTESATTKVLSDYLNNEFSRTNPIGAKADTGVNDREVDWTDNKIKLPSVTRGNVAVDYRLPFLDTLATVEVVQTYTDQSFFIRNENLKFVSYGADGRPRYAGNPAATNNTATAVYPNFLNLYHITNTSVGESTYATVSLDRPMKDKWAFNLAYTRGRSTDAQIFGSTTAGSQWSRNAVFAQNTVLESRSDFEIRNRVQLTLTRQFEFVKGWKSLASLYYEGHTGNPFSYVYSNDMNNDNVTANDLMAIPTDINDPRFDFSGMSAADQQAYFATLQATGLSVYSGGYAPRNAFYQPWINRLDLHLSQTIPIYKPAELELFLDFTNFGALISEKTFGYYERTTFVESDTYWRRTFGSATYNSAGKIVPVFAAPSAYVFDNPQSRWRVQVGAKLKF